jgi:hypothetical protein
MLVERCCRVDNCPRVPNPSQANRDQDAYGNDRLCFADRASDGLPRGRSRSHSGRRLPQAVAVAVTRGRELLVVQQLWYTSSPNRAWHLLAGDFCDLDGCHPACAVGCAWRNDMTACTTR